MTPFGILAKKNDIPLWLREDPHCLIEECTALKIRFAFDLALSSFAAKLECESSGSCGRFGSFGRADILVRRRDKALKLRILNNYKYTRSLNK